MGDRIISTHTGTVWITAWNDYDFKGTHRYLASHYRWDHNFTPHAGDHFDQGLIHCSSNDLALASIIRLRWTFALFHPARQTAISKHVVKVCSLLGHTL